MPAEIFELSLLNNTESRMKTEEQLLLPFQKNIGYIYDFPHSLLYYVPISTIVHINSILTVTSFHFKKVFETCVWQCMYFYYIKYLGILFAIKCAYYEISNVATQNITYCEMFCSARGLKYALILCPTTSVQANGRHYRGLTHRGCSYSWKFDYWLSLKTAWIRPVYCIVKL